MDHRGWMVLLGKITKCDHNSLNAVFIRKDSNKYGAPGQTPVKLQKFLVVYKFLKLFFSPDKIFLVLDALYFPSKIDKALSFTMQHKYNAVH